MCDEIIPFRAFIFSRLYWTIGRISRVFVGGTASGLKNWLSKFIKFKFVTDLIHGCKFDEVKYVMLWKPNMVGRILTAITDIMNLWLKGRFSQVSVSQRTRTAWFFLAVLLGELFHNDLHEFYYFVYPNSIGCWTTSSSVWEISVWLLCGQVNDSERTE